MVIESYLAYSRHIDGQDNEIWIEKIGIAVGGYLKHNCSPARFIIDCT